MLTHLDLPARLILLANCYSRYVWLQSGPTQTRMRIRDKDRPRPGRKEGRERGTRSRWVLSSPMSTRAAALPTRIHACLPSIDLKLHWRNHRSFVRSSVITLAPFRGKSREHLCSPAIFGFGSQDWTMNELLAPLMVFLSLSV